MSPKPNFYYFKMVLSKVREYPSLFNKELHKAKEHLTWYDYKRLKSWVEKFDKSKLSLD